VVIEPYIIYKAIYNYSFLDKEFLHSWCRCANNKGAMRSTSVSLASLWRPLYPLIILIVYLVCIFLSKPLVGSYIVEFGIPTYPGLYPSFLVAFPYLGLRA